MENADAKIASKPEADSRALTKREHSVFVGRCKFGSVFCLFHAESVVSGSFPNMHELRSSEACLRAQNDLKNSDRFRFQSSIGNLLDIQGRINTSPYAPLPSRQRGCKLEDSPLYGNSAPTYSAKPRRIHLGFAQWTHDAVIGTLCVLMASTSRSRSCSPLPRWRVSTGTRSHCS